MERDLFQIDGRKDQKYAKNVLVKDITNKGNYEPDFVELSQNSMLTNDND